MRQSGERSGPDETGPQEGSAGSQVARLAARDSAAGGPARGGPARGRNAERTREEIVRAAARHFARRGFAHVTLQDIAADADVTPALINRYFGSKRALFEVVATSEFDFDEGLATTPAEIAHNLTAYWRDVNVRTPAVALLRSMDLDDGALFFSELERRLVTPWRERLRGCPEAEAKVRLMTALSMGVGLFGFGALSGDATAEPSDDDSAAIQRRLARMIEAGLAD
ncbi:TetR/AcrR family transcriptional regulator [Dactylosporangium sp. CA-233914]|uniref:TetR/AcrR family transcriptional regulator n=1 Tax=Dactylosporangium sp. CA-233914 TaxID=3239934 RepID=UPI003D89B4D7